MSGNLEQRYRRPPPGWYRKQWEEGMVAAFPDSRLTGMHRGCTKITKGRSLLANGL